MTGHFVFCAFWLLYISNIKSMNAAPVETDNLLQNKYEGLSQKQKDCQVDNKYGDKNWSGESLAFMVYVEENEDTAAVAFSITFDNKDIYSVRDKLILSQKENEIHEYRNGDVTSQNLKTNIDISGWTQMEIFMIDQKVIVKYMDFTALNHTVNLSVKGVVIHGSNISVCDEKTPTYLVKTNISSMIPLVPSRQAVYPSWNRIYHLTLLSADKFTPCFSIGEDRTCLTEGNNKIIRSANFEMSHSTTQKLEMFLELIPGYINIYQEVDGEKVNVIRFHKQGNKFIVVSSVKNDFSVSMDIFPQPKAFTPGSVSTDNPSEGAVIYLKIGIAITIISSLATVIIVIIIARRQIQAIKRNNSTKTSNKEDNTMESELLNDDKNGIC